MSHSHNITRGPTAPENNPPINPQYFQPSLFDISALVLGVNTLVTTSVNHNYVLGQNVRLLIPNTYGSIQINERQGIVIAIPAPNQVLVDINSIGADLFIAAPSYGPTKPQIAAIGDVNSGPINANGRKNNGTFISGSFLNISPI